VVDQEKTVGVEMDEPEHKDRFDSWWEEHSLPMKILAGIGLGILGVGLLFLFGWVVMLLWNWLMPDIFGLKTLTYWKAWGLLALSCILFGRIGSGGSKGGGSDRKRKRRLRSYLREQYEAEKKRTETARQ
jgi:hypothetical protein